MIAVVMLASIAASAQAQTLAEAARRERERQAKTHSVRIITGEGIQKPAATEGAAKAGDAKPADTDDTAKPASPPPPKPATPDKAAAYNAGLDKLRARIRQLQDQETALQLQVNELTNQIFAPVTDQASKDQAQLRLGETQQRLTLIRSEVEQTRKTLDALQLQGPPK